MAFLTPALLIIRPVLSRFRNCENLISIAVVEEITYRQSRLCRLLGNPVAFGVVALLTNGKDLSTSEIAKAIGRSVPRTSNILGALRLAELVRYETEGRYARYRLKHPRQIRRILDALSEFVKTTSVARR
jgi:DNA-binding transcriptional ArsR family regulator